MDQQFYVITWHIDSKEQDVTCIRAYGVNGAGENTCLRINDFTPYVYMELPDHVDWNDTRAQIVGKRIDEMFGQFKPLKKVLVYKKKLYYYYENSSSKERKLFPYLFMAFSSASDIQKFVYKAKRGIAVSALGLVIKGRIHEQDATPILQLITTQDIPSAGWISFHGTRVTDEKETHCTHEYMVKWKNLKRSPSIVVPDPLLMHYDLEVNSSNINKMPTASKLKDVIFQVSCIFTRNSGKEDKYKKFLISLGDPLQEAVGKDVTIIKAEHEFELIEKFVDLIHEFQPNIICGYNIFSFDIPYMIERSKLLNVYDKMCLQGMHKFRKANERTIKWSSNAFKNQEFSYLDAEGRLYVDMLPIIMRDYKMDSYSLKAMSTYFLGETKDPLTHKDIFKCYRLGTQKTHFPILGSKALGLVGKYCVQDSVLVAKLFDHLQTWFGLSEMASTCNVPIFTLYTQGQQIKVFSQMYRECMSQNVVVEKDGYIPGENEHYMGAHVFDPVPGLYDCVVPFDFASLYPTVIIAYNIDYSTLVPEDNTTIKDSDCNIIEWDEHVGCAHDEKKRKTKPKYILCGHRRYRFVKSPKGLLPSLLENLISARKHTRAEMATIKEKIKTMPDGEMKSVQLTLLSVLEKRQLSYKVSANSGYGAMGVTKGYLPFMPGAMCTTARGRQSIELVAKVIQEQYKGKLIYGDTDSNYVVFPHLKTPLEIWEHAEMVSREVSKLFPKPMKLEFEEVIYWRFLILTMKRYMSLKCDKEGNVSQKIEKKGVLLSRRDNSNFVRTVYSDVIMRIFNREDPSSIIDATLTHLNTLCAHSFEGKNFIITKSVGDAGSYKSLESIPGKKDKVKLGGYSVPLLCTEGKKRAQQLALKNASNEEDYYTRCLPAQVQLAEKIRRRGGIVDVGSRIEFVILQNDNSKAKQYEKIESYDYYKEYASVLKIDFMYYLKALATPMDQVFDCTLDGKVTNFTMQQYKWRLQKIKVLEELERLFAPKLVFLG